MNRDRPNPVPHIAPGSDEVRSPSEPAFLVIGQDLGYLSQVVDTRGNVEHS